MLARSFRLSILALLLAATAPLGHAADPVVFNQPPTTPDDYTIWESANTPSGPLQFTYDDFTFASTTGLSAVQWYGNYIDLNTPSANPIAPSTTGFTFTFYADNNGAPGATLASTTVAQVDCAPVQVGTDQFSQSDDIPDYTIPFYSFRAVLPTPFVAAAGQRYWLSIVGNVPSQAGDWAWFQGTNGNGVFYHGTATGVRDRAFALEGTPAAAGAPIVAVATTADKADANSGTPAVITLTLSAPATDKLKVKYKLGGTAVNGTDYQALDGKATIKPGKTSVDIQIVPTTPPVGVQFDAFKKTVTLSVQPGNGYTVATGKPAKVKIVRKAGIILP